MDNYLILNVLRLSFLFFISIKKSLKQEILQRHLFYFPKVLISFSIIATKSSTKIVTDSLEP